MEPLDTLPPTVCELDPSSSRIVRHIDQRMIRRIPRPDPVGLMGTRRVLKVVTLIGSFAGEWPYLKPAARAADGNRPYAVFLMVGNATSFGCLMTWAYWNILDSVLRIPDRGDGQGCGAGHWICEGTRLGVATVIGTASTIPQLYLTYVDNHHKWYAPTVSLVCHTIVPVYSIWSLLDVRYCQRRRAKQKVEQQLEQASEMLINGLLSSNSDLLLMSPEGRRRVVSSLTGIRTFAGENRTETVTSLMRALLPKQLVPRPKRSWFRRAGAGLAWVGGGVLTAGMTVVLWELGRQATGELTGNELAKDSAATGIMFCWAKIAYDTVWTSPVRVYDSLANWWAGTPEPDPALQLRPKLYASLRLASLLLAGFAYGPTLRAAKLYLEEDEKLPFGIVASIAVGLMVAHAMGDLVSFIVSVEIESLGKEDERAVLKLHREVKELAELLKSSSFCEVAKLLGAIPEEALEQLRAKCEFTERQLAEYVDGIEGERRPLLPSGSRDVTLEVTRIQAGDCDEDV